VNLLGWFVAANAPVFSNWSNVPTIDVLMVLLPSPYKEDAEALKMTEQI
jgi:hypothetical protein